MYNRNKTTRTTDPEMKTTRIKEHETKLIFIYIECLHTRGNCPRKETGDTFSHLSTNKFTS